LEGIGNRVSIQRDSNLRELELDQKGDINNMEYNVFYPGGYKDDEKGGKAKIGGSQTSMLFGSSKIKFKPTEKGSFSNKENES
jgi:hypothetical protein